MAKLSILAGSTSQSVNIFIQDSSATSGIGLSGLAFNTPSLIAYYTFSGTNTTATAITLATLAAVTSAYSSGGFKEIDATNMKGLYRLDIPNAALATSKGRSCVIMLTGATNMSPCVLEIELTGVDNQDAVHFGLSSLPNATAGASTGLLISGVNSGTTTLGALVCTGIFTINDGIVISRSTLNASAVTLTGNGTGNGFVCTSGSGATGDGAQFISNSTNGNGFVTTGKGSGSGTKTTGGLTGIGLQVVGGGTSGDGLNITTTSGHGISSTASGVSKHGIVATGGTGGTSDGINAIAGTGGVDIRGNITGDVTGSISGSVGSVTGAVTLGTVNASASNIKKNTALVGFTFVMTDSTTHQPATGLTVTGTVSLNGGAFGAITNSVAEVSSGWYKVNLAAADLNGNTVSLRFVAVGADDRDISIITQP